MSNVRTCTHIKVTGLRCGSPALRGAEFCYFHQRMHRGVRTPSRARLHPIALIEDGESIQMALMEVINGLMRNTLEFKRATLILRALHIAVKNANRIRFESRQSDMIREVPDYDHAEPHYSEDGVRDLEIPFEAAYGPDPVGTKTFRDPKTAEQVARQRAEEIAHYYGYPTVEAHQAAKKERENGGSTASAKTSDTAKSAPAHVATAAPVTQPTTSSAAPPRKPPVSVKLSPQPARKESNARHRP